MTFHKIVDFHSGCVPLGAAAVVRGRIFSFCNGNDSEEGVWVRDDSGVEIRCIAKEPTSLRLGDWVAVKGEWDGASVQGTVQVLQRATRAFPSLDSDAVRVGSRIRALRTRDLARKAVRSFFDERGYLEVETPTMVPSPGLDLHLDAFGVTRNIGATEERWLITSPEYQMKRLISGGLTHIYQFARCFRRGEIGFRHEPEFTMLEWYRGFSDMTSIMTDTEELVAAVVKAVVGSTVLPNEIDVGPPWPRLTVREAFLEYAGIAVDSLLPDEEKFFRVFVEQVEPALPSHPLFLYAWPASMASLARLSPTDPSVAERFEAYIGGVELCNGFGELVNATEQRERLERDVRLRKAAGLPSYPIDARFLAALEDGLPPSAGNALGFDRLMMLLFGAEDIGDVIALPSREL